jgi:uncharacterized cupredoxin-like copper-binding protein
VPTILFVNLKEGTKMKLKILVMPAFLALAVLAFGCGGSSDSDSDATGSTAAKSADTEAGETSNTTSVPGAENNVITVNMSEYAFDPSSVTSKPGPATISAVNDGSVVHELVLLKTNADPAKLPVVGGEIDESTSVGEVADVEPGATKEATVDLTPGKYVMVCALPGHYEGGMYGALIVK